MKKIIYLVIIFFTIMGCGTKNSCKDCLEFRTKLNSSENIEIGTPIKYKGFLIGKVKGIALVLEESYVQVDFYLFEEYAPKFITENPIIIYSPEKPYLNVELSKEPKPSLLLNGEFVPSNNYSSAK